MRNKEGSHGASLKLFFALLKLIGGRKRKSIVRLTIISIISSVLEFFLLQVLYRVLEIITASPISHDSRLTLDSYFNQEPGLYPLILFVLALLGTFLRLYLLRSQMMLIAKISSDQFKSSLRRILTRDYRWIYEHGRAEVLAMITQDIDRYADAVRGLFVFTLNGIACLGILVGLLSISKVATLFLVILLAAYYLVYFVSIKRKMQGNTELWNNSFVGIHRTFENAYTSIKTTAVLKNEGVFVADAGCYSDQFRTASAEINFWSQTPRVVLDLMLLGSVALVSSLGLGEAAIPVFGTFTLAVFRVVVPVQQCFNGANLLYIGLPIIKRINLLEAAPMRLVIPVTDQLKKNDRVISISQVWFDGYTNGSLKAVGKNGKYLLKNISLEIGFGQKYALIGESGSGKSTLLDIVSGLIEPTRGAIRRYSSDQRVEIGSDWHKSILYLTQRPSVLETEIWRNIAYVDDRSELDSEKLEFSLQCTGMIDKVRRLPGGIDHILTPDNPMLSGGEIQRLVLSRIFYHRKDLLLLDEVMSALDLSTERFIIKNIFNYLPDTALIYITHRKDFLSDFDAVLSIKNGEVSSSLEATL